MNYFLKNFWLFTKIFFPRKKIKLKVKDIQSPWITSGIKISSKLSNIYILNVWGRKSKLENKNYKNVFETIKKRSKKMQYSKLITKYKKNIKNMVSSWRSYRIRKKVPATISKRNICGRNFNRYFTKIGPTLPKKVDSSSASFHKYLEAYNITLTRKGPDC